MRYTYIQVIDRCSQVVYHLGFAGVAVGLGDGSGAEGGVEGGDVAVGDGSVVGYYLVVSVHRADILHCVVHFFILLVEFDWIFVKVFKCLKLGWTIEE